MYYLHIILSHHIYLPHIVYLLLYYHTIFIDHILSIYRTIKPYLSTTYWCSVSLPYTEDGFDIVGLTFSKKKPQAIALTTHHCLYPSSLLLWQEPNSRKHISRTFLWGGFRMNKKRETGSLFSSDSTYRQTLSGWWQMWCFITCPSHSQMLSWHPHLWSTEIMFYDLHASRFHNPWKLFSFPGFTSLSAAILISFPIMTGKMDSIFPPIFKPNPNWCTNEKQSI